MLDASVVGIGVEVSVVESGVEDDGSNDDEEEIDKNVLLIIDVLGDVVKTLDAIIVVFVILLVDEEIVVGLIVATIAVLVYS